LAILVILILAILWAAVLVPPILRSRNDAGAGLGISDVFGRLREGLGHRGHGGDPSLPPLQPIMGPVGGMSGPPGPMGQMGPVRVTGSMSPIQRRRRDILVGILGLAGVTLLMALFSTGIMFWVLHLLADLALAGYVYMLLQFKARAGGGAERRPAQPLHRPVPAVPSYPNVHDLTARRFPPATSVAPVEGPREATVLALRRSASW
jgi:hypothetical protein